jgi:uroporphyrin-III C-methyltransferase
VACVQWAGTEHQRTLYTDLARAPAEAAEAGLGAPAVVIVGEVVDLAPGALAVRAIHSAGDPLPGSTYLEAREP